LLKQGLQKYFVTTTKYLVRSTKRLVAAAKFLVAATKILFVVPNSVAVTKPFSVEAFHELVRVLSDLFAWRIFKGSSCFR